MNFKTENCGFFDSKAVFGGLKETNDRVVKLYEIEYFPTDGETVFINGEGHSIKSGSLLIAKPGDLRHSILHFKAYYIHFSVCEPEFCHLIDNLESFYDTGNYTEKAAQCIKETIESSRGSGKNNALSECCMHRLIYELLSLDKSQSIEANKYLSCSALVRNAVSYINENYSSDISLSDIAKFVHLSPIYFHGLFERETGTTPYKLIMDKRIKKAVNMLETSDIKIADISAECGFSTQAYFGAVFKRVIGKTPKEYRKTYYNKYIGK